MRLRKTMQQQQRRAAAAVASKKANSADAVVNADEAVKSCHLVLQTMA
jgi:hypothetical protein